MKSKLLSSIVLWTGAFLSNACSDPFTVDRHDLITPRIIGVRQVDTVLEVQVWNGDSLYHTVTPVVEWLDDTQMVVANGISVDVETLDSTPSMVRYTDPTGEMHLATFALEPSTLSLTPSLYALPETTEFALDARLAEEGTLLMEGAAPDALRIAMSVSSTEPTPETAKMRWMTVDGEGTFLERSALETDFFRAAILMDRDELIENMPLEMEQATVLGLYVSGTGQNTWTWFDLWYTETTTITHANRELAVSELPTDWTVGQPIAVELEWQSEVGDWRLQNPSVDIAAVNNPFCAPVESAFFQWSWLEMGYCTVDDVDGLRIVLETR